MVRTSVFVAMATALVGLVTGMQLRAPRTHHCWNLVPVVVAAVDVPAGTPLTFEMISQRSVPEQFAERRMVKPDSAQGVIGRAPRETLEAGDVLRWSDFR